MPVLRFRIETETAGRTAPDSSVTVPWIVPPACAWARAGAAGRASKTPMHTTTDRAFRKLGIGLSLRIGSRMGGARGD
jgi:hypothetical protein